MPAKFLIDVNLPRDFSIWNSDMYIHQYDLGDEWPDLKIWKYAKENNLTIITKDSGFSTRIMMHTPSPRVIHVRVGNLKHHAKKMGPHRQNTFANRGGSA